ncbi:MAG: DnaB-like helicase C-terminal domain-containing protein [Polyangiaceae bacterium]
MLQDAGLEVGEESGQIMAYLEEYYRAYSAPPPIELVREYFEKQDKIEVSDRLDEVKTKIAYIRTTYRAICDSEREIEAQKNLQLLFSRAANINVNGLSIDKRVWRGADAAVEYASAHLSSFDRRMGEDSAASAFDALAEFESRPRMATGIPALDEQMGGGFPAPRFVVVGGGPGAGKTSLAAWWANAWMDAGHACCFLAVDEGKIGVVRRLCMMRGLQVPRTPMRPMSEEARAFAQGFIERFRGEPDPVLRARNTISALPAIFREEGTIEQATASLLRFADRRGLGKVPVLVVDSLQTVQSAGSSGAPDPRQRVDAVIAAIKVAVRKGVLVVATSELSRSAYRHKDDAQNVADIAAGKESGGIEYKAESLVILKQKEDQIRVTVPKNRGRGIEPFALTLDKTTMSFAQVTIAAPSVAEDVAVLREILARKPLAGVREIYAACKEDGRLRDHIRVDEARGQLEKSGLLKKVDGVYVIFEPDPSVAVE